MIFFLCHTILYSFFNLMYYEGGYQQICVEHRDEKKMLWLIDWEGFIFIDFFFWGIIGLCLLFTINFLVQEHSILRTGHFLIYCNWIWFECFRHLVSWNCTHLPKIGLSKWQNKITIKKNCEFYLFKAHGTLSRHKNKLWILQSREQR